MSAIDAGDAEIGLAVLIALLVVVAIVAWLIQRAKRGAPVVYGANPNPARITDAMWWLWGQLQALEPSSKLGGIYANKPGYHNGREYLPAYDYSVADNPPDWGGPSDKAAAIDWTFPDAQSGDYSTIALYTRRLLASAQDPDDHRLDGWREFFGNADDDTYVEGWDCRYGCPSTSDSSHLWHIHASEDRDKAADYENKEKFLSVVRGDPSWAQRSMGNGDGGVLVTCPSEPKRTDLFYVVPGGGVMHKWWSSGNPSAMWTGSGVKTENLGGGIVVGTLSATWLTDGSGIYVAGLGAADEAACPPGCGNYWANAIYRDGHKTGWGSIMGAYGAAPGSSGRLAS
jgi:hypothetical protein